MFQREVFISLLKWCNGHIWPTPNFASQANDVLSRLSRFLIYQESFYSVSLDYLLPTSKISRVSVWPVILLFTAQPITFSNSIVESRQLWFTEKWIESTKVSLLSFWAWSVVHNQWTSTVVPTESGQFLAYDGFWSFGLKLWNSFSFSDNRVSKFTCFLLYTTEFGQHIHERNQLNTVNDRKFGANNVLWGLTSPHRRLASKSHDKPIRNGS